MARRCRAVNRDVLANPKVRLIFNDAREVLLTTARRYDLIACEPSNPYRSGIANLFTPGILSCRPRSPERRRDVRPVGSGL